MPVGCDKSGIMGLTPRSIMRAFIFLLCVTGSMQKVKSDEENAPICQSEVIPESEYDLETSTSQDVAKDDGWWCPEDTDTDPYWKVTMKNDSEWALKWIRNMPRDDKTIKTYAASFSSNATSSTGTTLPLFDKYQWTEANSTGTTFFSHGPGVPLPFASLSIKPTASLVKTSEGGFCMGITLEGCRVADLCPDTECANNGRCAGINKCACDEMSGFSGHACTMSAEAVLASISFGAWIKVNDRTVRTTQMTFTSSLEYGGFYMRESSIVLTGQRSALLSTDRSSCLCLVDPDSCTSFYMSFTFALNSLSSLYSTGLLGSVTNDDSSYTGVHAWLNEEDNVVTLHVEVQRRESNWYHSQVMRSFKLRYWMKLEIGWDIVDGLFVSLDGEESTTVVSRKSKEEATDAEALVIGCPFYNDTSAEYNVSLAIKTFTYTNVSWKDVRKLISKECPQTCGDYGMCSGDNQCDCLSGSSGPLCRYSETGVNMSSLKISDGVLASAAGTFKIESKNESEVSEVRYGFKLNGQCSLTAEDTVPQGEMRCLVHPDDCDSFTVSLWLTVEYFEEATYIMCTNYGTDDSKGVNLVMDANQTLIVQINLPTQRWEVTYSMSEFEEKLMKGMVVEFSYNKTWLGLYVNNELVSSTNSEMTLEASASTVRKLTFGRSYSDETTKVEMKVQSFSVTAKSRSELMMEERKETTVFDMSPEETTEAPITGVDFDVQKFFEMKISVVKTMFTVLTSTNKTKRQETCKTLEEKVEEPLQFLESYWKSGKSSDNSFSVVSYLKFTQVKATYDFKSICDDDKELPSECDVEILQKEITAFFRLTFEFERGPERCSMMWMSHLRIEKLMKTCDVPFLKRLMVNMKEVTSIACSPPTCNEKLSGYCIEAAIRVIKNVSLVSGQGVCNDLKVSLACATNHTIDCKTFCDIDFLPKLQFVKQYYYETCNIPEPEPDCTEKLSKDDTKEMLMLTAYGNFFDSRAICNLWKWEGLEFETNASSFGYSRLEETCNFRDCPCTKDNYDPYFSSLIGDDICRNVSVCLKDNRGCGKYDLFTAALDLQTECSFDEESISQLPDAYTQILKCLKPVTEMEVGKYCSSMKSLLDCVKKAEKFAEDDDLLKLAVQRLQAIVETLEDIACDLSDEEGDGECHDADDKVRDMLLKTVMTPFYSLAKTKEICSEPQKDQTLPSCVGPKQKYLDTLHHFLKTYKEEMCQQNPVKGSGLETISGSMEELVKSFVVEGMSPCTLYPKVEACVVKNTLHSTPAIRTSFRHVLAYYKKLAQSTCCKGVCDPAAAVLCLTDVHHKSKQISPDWEGICHQYVEDVHCSKTRVEACDKDQKDTVKIISTKIVAPLVEICKDPPVTKCRAMAAETCIDKLKSKYSRSENTKETDSKDSDSKDKSKDNDSKDKGKGNDSKDKGKDNDSKDKGKGNDSKDKGKDNDSKDKGKGNDSKDKGKDNDSKDKGKDNDSKDKGKGNNSKDKGKDNDSKDKGKDNDSKDKGKDNDSKDKDNKEKRSSENIGRHGSKNSDEILDNLICLDVFEARECVNELVEECETSVELAIRNKLEQEVLELNAEECEEDKIFSTCYDIFQAHVEEFWKPDRFSSYDASHKYRRESQESDETDTDDSDQTKKTSQESDEMDNNNSNQTKKMSQESDERGSGRKDNIGKLCTKIKVAYDCAMGSLTKLAPAIANYMKDILELSWSLVDEKCKDHEVPLACFTCDNIKDNMLCNNSVTCDKDHQMCSTEVTKDDSGMTITKGCVAPETCKPGCDGNSCTFCCDKKDCNEPDDGPIPDTCNMVEVSICLFELSGTFLETETVDCSLVKEKTACVESVRKECEYANKTIVSEKLSGFLASSTVLECEDPCGVDKMKSFASILSSDIYEKEKDDTTYCELLQTMKNDAAKMKCGEKELEAGEKSLALLQSQLSCDQEKHCNHVPLECLKVNESCGISWNLQCIEEATEDCEPVQRMGSLSILRFQAESYHCDTDEIPTMPDELQPLNECLQEFAVSFSLELSKGGMNLSITVTNLLWCVINTVDIDILLDLPPAYQVYFKKFFLLIWEVLLPAVKTLEDYQPEDVTDEFLAALQKASTFITSEVIFFLFEPFGPRDFTVCEILWTWEAEINVIFKDVNTQTTKNIQTRLSQYRMTFCPDPFIKSCSVDIAQECLQEHHSRICADSIDNDEICNSLLKAVSCVEESTLECKPAVSWEVTMALMRELLVHRRSCPDVFATVCEHSDFPAVINEEGICTENSTNLDECDNTHVNASCRAAENVAHCYRKEIGGCSGQAKKDYEERFSTAFPGIYKHAPDFCGIDFSKWKFSNDTCSDPVCNIAAANECKNDLSTSSSTAADQVTVNKVTSCVENYVSGCDVFTRTSIYHETYLDVRKSDANLDVFWTHNDPLHDDVLLFYNIFKELYSAFTAQDLLPMFMVLRDLSSLLEKNTLFGFAFSSYKELGDTFLHDSLDGEFSNQNFTLPEQEHEDCPAHDIYIGLINATLMPIMTRRPQETQMDSLNYQMDYDSYLDDCSPGLRQRVKLMKKVIEPLTGMICNEVQYCSVSRFRQCTSSLIATVGNIGKYSSTSQVCSSVEEIDECTEQFSFGCGQTSLLQIKSRAKSLRSLAVKSCKKKMDWKELPTCEDPEDREEKTCIHCFRSFFEALFSYKEDHAHSCMLLQQSQDCFKNMTKACPGGKILDEAFFTKSRDWFNCSASSDDSVSDNMVCTKGCHLSEAEQCIKSLSHSLQQGEDCRENVNDAWHCLDQHTNECNEEIEVKFVHQLKAKLSSLSTEHCEDFYTCFLDFFKFAHQILPDASDNNPGSDNLFVLCDRYGKAAACVERNLASQNPLMTSLLKEWIPVVDHYCTSTKRLECRKCSGVDFKYECTELETCEHKQLCGSIFTTEGVTRGCMSKDKCDSNSKEQDNSYVHCCDKSRCNNATDAVPQPAPEDSCEDIGHAFICTQSYVMSLAFKETPQCNSSLEKLQCVATYSNNCALGSEKSKKDSDLYDKVRKVSEAANKQMIWLGSGECPPDLPPKKCDSPAVGAAELQLKVRNFITEETSSFCSNLIMAFESLDYLEVSEGCTKLDLLHQRVKLHQLSSSVFPPCLPKDCEIDDQLREYKEKKKRDCKPEIKSTILCVAENGDNQVNCSQSKCKILSLEGCKLSSNARNWMNSAHKHFSECWGDYSVPEPDDEDEDEEKSRSICDRMSLVSCLEKITASKDDRCSWLQEEKECIYKYGESSGTDMDVRKKVIKHKLAQYCNASLSDSAYCEDNFFEIFMGGFKSSQFEEVCRSASVFDKCRQDNPEMNTPPMNLFMKQLKDLDVCTNNGPSGDRPKRDVTEECPQDEANNAVFNIIWSLFGVEFTPESQNSMCREVHDGVQRLERMIEGCFENNLSQIIKLVLETGRCQLRSVCDVVEYTLPSCEPNLFPTAWDALSDTFSNANTEASTQCRAAKRALKGLHKFTQECDNGVLEKSGFRKSVKYMVGNTCPKLTLGLFCPEKFPNISYSSSCDYPASQKCLEDAGKLLTVSQSFCSDVSTKVDCIQRNLQGCQHDQIVKTRDSSVSLKATLDGRFPSCTEVNPSVMDYNDVCVAEKTCSITSALKCMQIKKEMEEDDCNFLSRMFKCMKESLASCAESSMAEKVAFELFSFQFGDKAKSCTDIQAPSDRLTCIKDFLNDMKEGLVTNGNLTSVCRALSSYVTCSTTEGSSAYVPLLYEDMTFVKEMQDSFCDKDIAVSDPGEQCDSLPAAYCVAEEMTWVLMVPLFTRSDSQEFCHSWREQSVKKCIDRHTKGCSAMVIKLFDTVSSMSTIMVKERDLCEKPAFCYISEAYFHIHEFTAAIIQFEIIGHPTQDDHVKLCSHKAEMEKMVDIFTAKCTSCQQVTIQHYLERTINLVNESCKDVDLPPEPLCPYLPSDKKRCSYRDALSCAMNFTTHLLHQGPSLIWHDWCNNLWDTFQCLAMNTATCHDPSENPKVILAGLDGLMEASRKHCTWLSDDLCSRALPCPAQSAGCDRKLEVSLHNKPLAEVCSLISEAKECVKKSTGTCTEAQTLMAERTIKQRIEDLSISDLTCDGSDVVPCLMQAKRVSWEVLTRKGDLSEACEARSSVKNCLTSNMKQQSSVKLTSVTESAIKMLDGLDDLCKGEFNNSDCGYPLAKMLDRVYAWVIQVADAKDFNTHSFCSTRNAMLRGMEFADLASPSCDSFFDFEFSVVRSFLESDESRSMCDAPTERCATEADFRNCTEIYDGDCSTAKSALRCLAPVMGLVEKCAEEDSDKLRMYDASAIIKSSYKDFLAELNPKCPDILPIALLTSNEMPLYIAEQGGYAEVSFKMLHSTGSIRIQARVNNTDPSPLTCLDDASEKIPQLLVVTMTGESCGFKLEKDDDISEVKTFKLIANQDLRQDGLRKVAVTLFAEYSDEASDYTSDLITYEVYIQDNDISNSMCISVGDPYLNTFDQTSFNIYENGKHILYRNTLVPVAVTVDYQRCRDKMLCTCEVDVVTQTTVVRFDGCKKGEDIWAKDIEVTMVKNSGETNLIIYRGPDDKSYYVVLPTGTQITVKSRNKGIDIVKITPSGLDLGRTEGLCGIYDGDAYNDLLIPNGQRCDVLDDVSGGILTPKCFISSWLVGESDDVLHTDAKNFAENFKNYTKCNCLDSVQSYQTCGNAAHASTCDFVQGTDITDLIPPPPPPPIGYKRRRRRAVADPVDYTITVSQMGWPTNSGWTQETAREKCEELLEEVLTVRYCSQAVRTANGTYSFESVIIRCVENIRLSDSLNYMPSSITLAEEKCKLLLLRNTTYQKTARPAVLGFLQHTCSNNCNGNGNCQMGVCHCFPGFVGGECSHHQTNLPRPKNIGMHTGLCPLSDDELCQDIFITGQDFVNSAFFSCHIQSVLVTSSGQHRPLEASVKVPATLITSTLVHCQFTRSQAAHQTVTVTVSNDGVEQTDPVLFTAYDPYCYTCQSDTHYCSPHAKDTCEINGRCYRSQEASRLDPCLVCNPSSSEIQWSIRNSRECSAREVEKKKEVKEEEGFSPIHAGIIGVCVAVLVIAVVVVLAIVIKKRYERKSIDGDQEEGHSQSAYDNPGYNSSQDGQSVGEEPQESFRHGSVHKRAVTAMTNNTPAKIEGEALQLN